MADGTREFHVRQRNRTPAREPFPLPPPLQRMLDLGKATLAAPFKGVTADGTATPGLFRLEKTGHSLQPVVDAARAFLMSLPPDQRATARVRSLEPDVAGVVQHPSLHDAPRDLPRRSRRRRSASARSPCMRASMSAERLPHRARRDEAQRAHARDHQPSRRIRRMALLGQHHGRAVGVRTPWGWQIDGHHLIVNCFVLGDQMVLTPNFMGSEPVHASTGKYRRHHASSPRRSARASC